MSSTVVPNAVVRRRADSPIFGAPNSTPILPYLGHIFRGCCDYSSFCERSSTVLRPAPSTRAKQSIGLGRELHEAVPDGGRSGGRMPGDLSHDAAGHFAEMARAPQAAGATQEKAMPKVAAAGLADCTLVRTRERGHSFCSRPRKSVRRALVPAAGEAQSPS